MTQELFEKVLRSPRLPSLPAVALQLIELTQDPDVSISRLADTVRKDPALSSKILRTVNSSFYGQAQPVSTISRALVVLGLSTVKTLALGFSLVGTMRRVDDGACDRVAYWRRSLYTATAARTLSEYVGLPRREEAFLGGLFQDIGILAMSQVLGDEYRALVRRAADDHEHLCMLERDRFGVDHAEVGATLAEHWNLPPLLVAPIRYHESPDDADEEMKGIIRCVFLGNRVAELFLSEDRRDRALELYHARIGSWFDVTSELADPILAEIHEHTEELAELFDLPTGVVGDPDEILARAHETLAEMTVQSQLLSAQLKRENRQLVDEVKSDVLTGARSRRAFDAVIDEACARASASCPLSVLFADVDRFKNVNDTYGHAVGDRVLKVFAATLDQAVGEAGTVFRYGGEEFAVVCPGTDAPTAASLAERVRQAVERTARVRARDCEHEVAVTCSIGVATHAGGGLESAEAVVKAADAALYVAKAEGRNCVRLSTPPTGAPVPGPAPASVSG